MVVARWNTSRILTYKAPRPADASVFAVLSGVLSIALMDNGIFEQFIVPEQSLPRIRLQGSIDQLLPVFDEQLWLRLDNIGRES